MEPIKDIFPRWVWLVFVLLFSLSSPWYLSDQLAMKIVLGLPFWVITAILAMLAVSFFTVFVIYKYWTDSE